MKAALDRRLFLTGAAGLALAGCDRIAATKPGRTAFVASGNATYEVQSKLRHGRLAQEFPDSAISKVFKPNGSIDPKDPAYKKLAAEKFAGYALQVSGLVEAPRSFTLADLKGLPVRTQVTRHDCVEGWSCIGRWTGVPLHEVLQAVRIKPDARFIVFRCFDKFDTDFSSDVDQQAIDAAKDTPFFYGSIGMDDALHPQTILAYGFNGEDLPVSHGAPLRVRVERQLGYKMTKYIKAIEVVSEFDTINGGNGGYWEDQGYEWYGGI